MDDKRIESDVRAAVDAGQKAAALNDRLLMIDTDAGKLPVVLLNQNSGQEVKALTSALKLQERFANAPRRIKGTATHQEIGSFVAHVNRFKDPNSVIWADVDRSTLTAVLNYHGGNQSAQADGSMPAVHPRWSDHRAVYTCPLSVQWKRWIGANEKWMGQADFAALIEDNLQDLTSAPGAWEDAGEYTAPAKVVQAIRMLAVHTSTKFRSEINRETGETNLLFQQEHDKTDVAKIPRAFVLGIPVYTGGELYAVKVKIRFRSKDSVASFQYAIQAPEVILRDAFSAVRKQAEEGTGLPLFVGAPEVAQEERE